MAKKKLTSKQAKFIDEYMIDLNATQAAIRAGYSKKTAYSQGQRLLKNVDVKKNLDKRKEKVAKKSGVTRDEIINRLNKRSILVEELQALAAKEKLTTAEENKLARLLLVIKTSDANKSDEILNKMLGYNATEKSEVIIKEQPLFLDPEDKEEDE